MESVSDSPGEVSLGAVSPGVGTDREQADESAELPSVNTLIFFQCSVLTEGSSADSSVSSDGKDRATSSSLP